MQSLEWDKPKKFKIWLKREEQKWTYSIRNSVGAVL